MDSRDCAFSSINVSSAEGTDHATILKSYLSFDHLEQNVQEARLKCHLNINFNNYLKFK